MRVIYSRVARLDLNQAFAYVALNNPAAARRMLGRVTRAIERLAAGEIDGKETHLLTSEAVRKWVARPFGIYYTVTPDAIEVVRVYHLARRPIEH